MTRKGKADSIPTAIRMIRMMQLIPRHSGEARGRIGAQALHEQLEAEGFAVSLRTVQRDLRELQAVFPGLKNDGNRDALGWYWESDGELMDIPAMDAPLALAFKLAEQYLAPVAPSVTDALAPYLQAAGKALDERAQGWLERVAIVPRSQPLLPAHVDPEVARTVQVALLERRRFRVRYQPRNGEVAEYELSPQGLVLRHEVSYLVATAWDYTDPRHYALHRMQPEAIELLETQATELPDFDLQRYIDEGGFHYRIGDRPLRLELRMRVDLARHLEETPLSENQHIGRPGRDGWLRLRATVPDTLQLRWWLLGLGNQVEVIRPKALRREIAETLASALPAYAD